MTLQLYKKYGVIGSGAWGTALTNMLVSNNIDCEIFARDIATVEEINNKHTNNKYLPGITLHHNLRATNDLGKLLSNIDVIILAVPAQKTRSFIIENKSSFPEGNPIILCAKGIEQTTGLFMSQIIEELLPNNPALVLSGPSFADDVVRGLATAVTLACKDIKISSEISKHISNNNFRCYISDDIIGAQIGGALKNVFAIACGAAAGYNLGESAKASLITRSFAEIRRIGLKLGGRIESLCGLSGLGDLILSCNSTKSRNFAYGYNLGSGTPPDGRLTEGYYTAYIAAEICKNLEINAPLIFAIKQLLSEETTIEQIYTDLITRPLKIED